MANDRIYARCTFVDEDGPCPWRIMLFKYWQMPLLGVREERALREIAEHWESHDRPLDFNLGSDPGFRFATELTVDQEPT